MTNDHILVPIDAFLSALQELNSLEAMASKKANVGYKGKYTVEDTFALAIACMAFAAKQDLIGYLSEYDWSKIEKAENDKQTIQSP